MQSASMLALAEMTEAALDQEQQEILDKLLANPILGKTDPKRLRQVVGHCKLIKYRAGRKLIREGEPADAVFALVSGGVRVFHRGPKEEEIVVKLFGAPVFFGEADVLLRIPWLESVETVLPSEVVKVPGNVFDALLKVDHGLSYAMVTDLSTRLLIATEQARALAFGSAELRLAQCFVDHLSLFGTPDEETGGTLLDVRLSQDSIAKSLAISRKTVNQTLKRWKESEVLIRRAGRYIILDLDRLEKLTSASHFGLAYTLDEE